MSFHKVDLSSLQFLDSGKAFEAFNSHLRRVANDCLDRPGDNRPRKVTLEVSLVPVLESDLDCTEVRSQLRVTSAIPKHQTKVYSFAVRKGGMLVFSEDSPDNVNQSTIFDDEKAEPSE